MADKTFNTRIALLYRTYAEYEAKKNTTPLKGEVCIVEIPQSTGAVVQEPAVLFKVGDGVHTWANIPWTSAKAADVFDWAKRENLTWEDLTTEFKNKLTSYIKPDLDKKVDIEKTGANGKSLIFNEGDGGGAKFEHEDGTWSYTGVNDGGASGIAAQIYAVDNVTYKGAKLDVTKGGIYYTTGDRSGLTPAQRDVAENEIVVRRDIADLAGGMHFIGVGEYRTGVPLATLIEEVYVAQGKTYADRKAGDLVILKDETNDREFICDTNKEWVELGDQGLYATKAELAVEASTRAEDDATLQANINAEETRAKAAEATKTDKKVVGTNGTSEIFNEGDGGGSKLTGTNGVVAYVGTHDSIGGEIGTQIYVDKANGTESTIIDITQNGAYYTKGTIVPGSQRDVEANEIATKGNVKAEETRAKLAEEALDSGKLDIMPGDAYTANNPYNLPYYFETSADATKVTVTAHTVTLDGKKTHGQYALDVPAATTSKAGLMTAADRVELAAVRTDLTTLDDSLATVARTGNVKDIIQDSETTIILDCNY